jgi:hypothetical protein
LWHINPRLEEQFVSQLFEHLPIFWILQMKNAFKAAFGIVLISGSLNFNFSFSTFIQFSKVLATENNVRPTPKKVPPENPKPSRGSGRRE